MNRLKVSLADGGRRLLRIGLSPGFWLLTLIVLVVVLGIWNSARKPGSPLLLPGGGGAWIRMAQPFILGIRQDQEQQVVFRTRFQVHAENAAQTIQVEARERVYAFIDRQPFYREPAGGAPWPAVRTLHLPQGLAPGDHVLEFLVIASHTHPLLKVGAPRLALASGGSWQASVDTINWPQATLAADSPLPELAATFPTSWQALGRIWPWLALAGLVGAGASLLQTRRGWRTPEAGTMRWAFLFLWAVLAGNNLVKLPCYVGMDLLAHLEYVKYIAQFHRLPLATEGWQLFQPPLNYLLCAPLYAVFPAIPDERALIILRVLPLLCGLLQVEVCYRAIRAVFPGRNGLQIAGTALCAFLPMNIYISQVLGNEPLAGLLCALAVLWVLVRHRQPGTLLEPRFAVGLGGLLGLALLTKVTVLLVMPWLGLFCLLQATPPEGTRIAASLRFAALLCGAVLLTAGGYFGWTWFRLGQPFMGGWDPARGIVYWQDPGFISSASLTQFGSALVRPIYAGSAGFWNGLYSTLWLDGTLSSKVDLEFLPPWNYSFLLASSILALAPCAALAAGAVTAWRRPPVALSLVCLASLVLAILHLHITAVPSYAGLKATYLLGLLPCFGILTAAGLEALARGPWRRALAVGLGSAWAVTAYSSYFIW